MKKALSIVSGVALVGIGIFILLKFSIYYAVEKPRAACQRSLEQLAKEFPAGAGGKGLNFWKIWM